jgi:AcrR family transcriptional regulator
MEEKKYHNKDLKEKLINKGLQHLNEVGYDQFSIRKVASLCEVSHNAPYRHFTDKEELIRAILDKAVKDFESILLSAVTEFEGNPLEQIRWIGINYINFFVENPEYLKLFFDSEMKGTVYVKDNTFTYDNAYLFGILFKCISEYYNSIGRKQEVNSIVVIEFWSVIHGLTIFIANKKIVFLDDYKKYVYEMMDRRILKLREECENSN